MSGGPRRSQGNQQHQRKESTELQLRGYQVGKKLGEGSYAKVVSAYSEQLQKHVAIKIVRLNEAPEDFATKFFPRELEILAHVDHPNIVSLYDKFDLTMPNANNSKVEINTYIVMEIAGHGDLLDYIKLRSKLSEGKSKFFLRQLIEAIEYLHKQNIIHRDLKCENLLLDNNNNLKVSDFGFARFMKPDEESNTYCGSAAYAAPEVLKGEPYSGYSYDIWSLGIILYIMVIVKLTKGAVIYSRVKVCGKMPFDDSDLDELYRLQCERHYTYPSAVKDTITFEVKQVIEGILNPDISTRYSIADIRSSEWLCDIPYQIVGSVEEFKALVTQYDSMPARETSNTMPDSPTMEDETDEDRKHKKKNHHNRHHHHKLNRGSKPKHRSHQDTRGIKAGFLSLVDKLRSVGPHGQKHHHKSDHRHQRPPPTTRKSITHPRNKDIVKSPKHKQDDQTFDEKTGDENSYLINTGAGSDISSMPDRRHSEN